MANGNNMIRLTGLWKNTSKAGKDYLKGNLSPAAGLLVMRNEYKKGDNDPDYFVYLAPNGKRDDGSGEAAPGAPAPNDFGV